MNILFDHQTFSVQSYGGISRYFYELIKNFGYQDDIETDISLILSDNAYIKDKKNIKHININYGYNFKGKDRILSFINRLSSVNSIKKSNFDIFHPTYYDTYFLKYIKDKPFVVTIYDMIHEKFGDMISKYDFTSHNKKILCEKSSKIIAISENTKRDLMNLWGIKESKIEVIHLANSMTESKYINIGIKIPEKYILFVGGRGSYKNFIKLINSIYDILLAQKELNLVCVGGGKFTAVELKLFKELGIIDRLYQYTLSDSSLSYVYSHAEFFIFPSLYEGFGIPVLEAFQCKCPIVCSNTSSLPEIAKNGALYFDPHDSDSIKTSIIEVLKNKKLKQELITNGNKILKDFSWQITAEKTKQTYREIL